MGARKLNHLYENVGDLFWAGHNHEIDLAYRVLHFRSPWSDLLVELDPDKPRAARYWPVPQRFFAAYGQDQPN